jgi:hypothetical protein
MKTAGIIILIIGLIMTLYSGFTYVTREKVLDVGEFAITQDSSHAINWQPYVGIGTMVIGGTLLILGRKHPLAL